MIESTFHQALDDLARRANCMTFDRDLWELIFTHKSFAHEHTIDEEATGNLLEVIRHIGREALRAAIYEYCLNQKGLDSIETSRAWQGMGAILNNLVQDFQLVLTCRVGNALQDSEPNRGFQDSLAFRFLAGIILSSSYDNLKNLIWPKVESILFSSSTALSYHALDPKSWLQEYAQRYHRGKEPLYHLVGQRGPDHQKIFDCRVTLSDGRTAEGSAGSIKEAHKVAAASFITKYHLVSQDHDSLSKARIASTVPKTNRKTLLAPFLEYNQIEINRLLLNTALVFSNKLEIRPLKINTLAIALTLPSNRYKGPQTNAGLKLLGDALLSLAFAIFAFQTMPTRLYKAGNVSQFGAVICSDLHYAALFDFLGLHILAKFDREAPLSTERKADIIKAVAAAIYISAHDFGIFFAYLKDKLASWCLARAMFSAENPLAIRDPKTFLQELLQAQKSFRAEYTENHQGGQDHRPVFSTTLALENENTTIKISKGVGDTLKEAQQAAALGALQLIIPMADGVKLDPIVAPFWKKYFDRLLSGETNSLVGACGVEQLKMLNAFSAYFNLKAFATSLPALAVYLEKPESWQIIARSVGRLPTPSPSDAVGLAKTGIAIIASKQPDNVEQFTSHEVDTWLSAIRKASIGLKLPSQHIDYPVHLVEVSDIRRLREWNVVVKDHSNVRIPETLFSHIVTILEALSDDDTPHSQVAATTVESGACWSRVSLSLPGTSLSKLRLTRMLEQLSWHAFFSGAVDSATGAPSEFTIESIAVSLEDEAPHARAYVEVMRKLYRAQSNFKSLHRVVHDIKNQVVAVRNYARRAQQAPTSKYQMFAAIEQVQDQLLGWEPALGVYFRAVTGSPSGLLNLKDLAREYMIRQIALLPNQIQPQFTERVDNVSVIAKKDLLLSLLTNLVQNAVDAMPHGGLLSVSISLKADDLMLIIQVEDTGRGIAAENIPELFTSLRSTKRRGMGLGLATIKTIVDQYNGLIDVKSKLGSGTQFTILLPMQKEGGDFHASASD